MNKSDLKEIKDIVDSALGTHLASVHEELTDLRNELTQEVNELRRDLSRVETTLTGRIDHVDEKLANFENRELDKRLQLEVRVGRLEKQRDAKAPYRILCILDAQGHIVWGEPDLSSP